VPPELIHIHDPDDPRLSAYRDIRERDLAGREGLFIAEGKVVLDVLFSARRFEVRSLLLLDRRVEGMADTLRRAPAGIPVYVAGQEAIDRVAGFHLHRGVLAVGGRRPGDTPERLVGTLPARALVVVAVGISNHDNMGAIFRNAAAFGADAVIVDETSCDPLYRKAIRVSVGAALKVPFARGGDAGRIVAALAAAGIEIMALSPRGERDIAAVERRPRMALVLGSEGEGLPPSLLSSLPTARIEMAAGFDSLNVATAAAIALHRLGSPG
jgi:tRNA G18 (ribose-2'-O)-methylase SpoU